MNTSTQIEIASFILETLNCSTIESCQAMESIYSVLDSYEPETTSALRAAGFVVVDFSDEEIEYAVSMNF